MKDPQPTEAIETPSPAWWSEIVRSRQLLAAELGERRLPPADEIIREMREERDRHIAAAAGLNVAS